MRTLVKPAVLFMFALGITSVKAAQVDFILDGHKYSSPADIVYQTDNSILKNSLVEGCTSNGQPITDLISGVTFKTGDNTHINLSSVQFNLNQGRLYLSTVLGNVICEEGVFEDDLFTGGFE